MNDPERIEAISSRKIGQGCPLTSSEIDGMFVRHPIAISLYIRLKHFYGDVFEARLCASDSDNGVSSCRLVINRTTGNPTVAEIALTSHPGRRAEGFAHELLHMRLYSLGFIRIDVSGLPCLEQRAISDLRNVIEHDWMIDPFERLGFDRKRFLSVRADPFDTIDKQSLWCRRVKVVASMLPSNQYNDDDQRKVRESVSDDDVSKICLWVSRRVRWCRSNDLSSFNEILAIVGLPRVGGYRRCRGSWIRIEPS